MTALKVEKKEDKKEETYHERLRREEREACARNKHLDQISDEQILPAFIDGEMMANIDGKYIPYGEGEVVIKKRQIERIEGEIAILEEQNEKNRKVKAEVEKNK